jgi:hypothetical protein
MMRFCLHPRTYSAAERGVTMSHQVTVTHTQLHSTLSGHVFISSIHRSLLMHSPISSIATRDAFEKVRRSSRVRESHQSVSRADRAAERHSPSSFPAKRNESLFLSLASTSVICMSFRMERNKLVTIQAYFGLVPSNSGRDGSCHVKTLIHDQATN